MRLRPMTAPLRIAALAAALLCGAGASGAAPPSDPATAAAAATGPVSTAPRDPLERETPRGTMEGFLGACRDGDYRRAAEYLDLSRMPRTEREARGPELARQLKVVLDRELWVDLDALSEDPGGELEDGLPRGREAVGEIALQRGPVPILLARSAGPDGVRLWRIAAQTVERIPDLYAEHGFGPLEPWLPRWVFELSLLEIALWQWSALLALVLAAAGLSWVAVLLLERGLRPLTRRSASDLDDRLVTATAQPLRLAAAIGIFHLGTLPLGLAVPVRRFLSEAESALAIVAITWFLLRLVNLFTLAVARRLQQRDNATALGVVPIGQKAVKTFVVALAVIAMLDSFGFDVTALLAGLGVGGIAVALAAQKTIENLFGGVTLLADRPVSVGDFCRFGDRVGTIEAVGLRSTRVRTLDRTVVTVPNSEFSTLQLENFTARDRIWYHPTIGLRYETTRDQVRTILARVREMLLAHPRVVPDPARIRFLGFGAYSLDLEVFAYVDATDYGDYLGVAEDLNLRIMQIVEENGASFAFPSQTVYLGRDDLPAPAPDAPPTGRTGAVSG